MITELKEGELYRVKTYLVLEEVLSREVGNIILSAYDDVINIHTGEMIVYLGSSFNENFYFFDNDNNNNPKSKSNKKYNFFFFLYGKKTIAFIRAIKYFDQLDIYGGTNMSDLFPYLQIVK